MPETTNALAALSDSTAQLVERTARSVVAVHSGGRWPASGIHWRSGIVVTAEEVLERDENIKLTLPGGRLVEASLAGRDPTTDVAVLRFQPDGLPVAATTNAAPRAGDLVLAVGNREGSSLAALGIVALAGGPWHSARGGTIDNFIRLDLALSPVGEGGALVDAHGQVMAMTVLGPRHRAIAIPASTIERAVDQLLARGQVFRGYLGAGLRPIGRERASGGSAASGDGRGVLVVSIDPDGPSRRAGLLLGDIVTAWNGKPIDRVREVMHLLGPESVGTTVDLGLTRGGAPAALKVVIGERPVK
jgi:S1-C subfamily serine protease